MDNDALERRLSTDTDPVPENRLNLQENSFRYQLNNDAMATEKLAEGIRNFVADQVKLERLLVEFDD